MAVQAEPFQVGLALVVQGNVRVESTNGISRVIEPNSQIFLDDQISTGSSGAVSIVLNDSDATQFDLGRLSEMTIDADVTNPINPELGDVAVEAGLVTGLLQNWEDFEPLAALDSVLPLADDSAADESAAADPIAGLDGSSTNLAAGESSDSVVDSIDDELDMTNFIPPPEDAS